jgi:sec-independent protein translocase protein TatC
MTPVPPDDQMMTFWEHLGELRRRIVYAAVAFVVGGVVSWIYRETLLRLLTTPFLRAWNDGQVVGTAALHFPAPQSLFVAYLKLAMLGGFVLALPVILYQIWAFIAPGLYPREKRLAIPFVVSSCGLFAAGAFFGWRVAFPVAFQYLLGFSGPVGGTEMVVQPTVMIGDYVEFVSRMLLAFGTVFELPVVVFFLSIAGLINHTHLIKFARYFVVIAFIVGAILTPPDPTSQFLLAVPLCALYFVSIGIAWLFGKKPVASPTTAS